MRQKCDRTEQRSKLKKRCTYLDLDGFFCDSRENHDNRNGLAHDEEAIGVDLRDVWNVSSWFDLSLNMCYL